jgi:hypothetical protein
MIADRHREWLRGVQEYQDAERKKEEAEREKAERPLRQAEQRLTETYRKLREVARQAALSERGDAEWRVPTELEGLSLDYNLAKAINGDAFRQFLQENQEYAAEYDCPEARDLVTDYLLRQGCQIANVEAYERAFRRLVEAGLLEPKPKPQPIPAPVALEETEFLPGPEPESEFYEGIDLATGRPKTYTRYQVNRMSADVYKRTFGIPSALHNCPGT